MKKPHVIVRVDRAPSEVVKKRAEHARAMLKKARTRLKRAETIEKKWAKKVAHYQKKGF